MKLNENNIAQETTQSVIAKKLAYYGHPIVAEIVEKEIARQSNAIELIASENFPSDAVLLAQATCFTNKYTEGYPVKRKSGNRGRYYGGCEYYDVLEEYCCDKWREVFNTDYHVNVQPHSGSSANLAAYMAVLQPGDTVLAMDLNEGGHLTHGSSVNFSGKKYNFVFYNLDKNGYIDYHDIYEKMIKYRPKLILAGASAYSRVIDFQRIYHMVQSLTDISYHPLFMVDMAHIAGLVAVGEHPSPFGLADIITTTTHKTLRGTRGGLIFCKPELAKKVDSAVFPGCQGGSLQHIIAAKAITAEEACTPEYKEYIHNVVVNTRTMAEEFMRMGYEVVTGGTDNHLFLIDFTRTHPWISGNDVQTALDRYHITLNKNCVPGETRSPKETSGVRIGCAAMTTKGYTAEDFVNVAREIDKIIKKEFGRNFDLMQNM